MKKSYYSVILMALVLITPRNLASSGEFLDKIITMRLYRGSRQAVISSSSLVIMSVQFRPLFIGQQKSIMSVQKEQSELKRIFNLQELDMLEQNQMVWNRTNQPDQVLVGQSALVINGNTGVPPFHIRLTPLGSPDRFVIDVGEGDSPKSRNKLLNSEMTLPPGQSVVMGFEDRNQQPFFISFYRSPVGLEIQDRIGEDAITLDQAPGLLQHQAPVYPEEAKRNAVQGTVLLKATLNSEGTVRQVEIVSGHPLLRNAAAEAVKSWRYEPYIVDNKAVPVRFSVKVDFKLTKEPVPNRTNIPSVWPTHGLLTSGYGKRHHPITGKPDFHNGQDIAAQRGTPVVATADGKVIFTGKKGNRGNTVIIDHGNGYVTLYAQLHEIKVKSGDRVRQGDPIGTVGSSGLSTAPHLHYEIHKDGKEVNPLDYFLD